MFCDVMGCWRTDATYLFSYSIAHIHYRKSFVFDAIQICKKV